MLTPAEADRAIYFDFEGFQHKSPALLGVLIEDRLERIVLDPVLYPGAKPTGNRTGELKPEIEQLMELAAREGRALVGFTQHEPRVVTEFCGIELGDMYVDAHKLARRWKNVMHHDEHIDGYDLLSFLAFTLYPVPAHLGVQKTTERLGYVRNMLLERMYRHLTPSAKRKWWYLLSHNEHDCRGMRHLMQVVAAEVYGA